MRKFLQVVGIAALVLLVVAPAMAIDFKFSGSYRFRMYAADGIGAETGSVTTSPFAKTSNNQRNQSDFRARPYFIVSDDNGNIQSHLRFEIGDVTFGDSSDGTVGRSSGGTPPLDGVNVETKWAFIDFQLPFGIPARLRAGAQPFYLPKGTILDDEAMGLRLYGSQGMFKYEAFWFQVDERTNGATVTGAAAGALASGPAADDVDVYGAKIDLALSPAFNPYLYGVYRHGSVVTSPVVGTNDTASSDGYWIGLGATGKLGIVNYDFDFVYGYDEPYLRSAAVGGFFQTRTGWMIDTGAEMPIGPVTAGLRFTYSTGDKADSTGNSGDTNEDFPAIMYAGGAPTSSMGNYGPKGSQIFWYSNDSTYWRGGYCSQCANNYAIGAYVQYNPVKALMTRLAYFYIGATKSSTNYFTGKSQIGQEISLVSEYELYTGFKLWGVAGILFTPNNGQTAAGGVELKDVTLFSVGMRHDF